MRKKITGNGGSAKAGSSRRNTNEDSRFGKITGGTQRGTHQTMNLFLNNRGFYEFALFEKFLFKILNV